MNNVYDTEKKILSMLGIAMRGHFVASGEFLTEQTIKEGKAYLVIVSDDASDNTKKKFRNSCDFYKIPFYIFGKKDDIGHAIGKEFRASLAVTDSGISKKIILYFNQNAETEA